MIIKSYFNKATVYTCLLIALCFLWSGSGYLSWMYHLLDYLFIALSITIPIGSAAIILGFIMNLFHGLVAGIYLSILSAFVAPNHCGFVFGTAYAIGSVGSYLLSIIGKESFLCNPSILILYACFVLVTIVILFCGKSMQLIE